MLNGILSVLLSLSLALSDYNNKYSDVIYQTTATTMKKFN